MKNKIKQTLNKLIDEYRIEHSVVTEWEEPLVGFADANGNDIKDLKKFVVDTHFMPSDFLKDASIVISYFLPFTKKLAQSNVDGKISSAEWALAYQETNKMAAVLNKNLASIITEWGYNAAVPDNIGMISENLIKSRWSQRHIARAAGLGTFGLNNMLITEKGCCGRFYSIITTLSVAPDKVIIDENCLYKKEKTCGLCVKRCISGALTLEYFNRKVCYDITMENAAIYNGADVCGKCVVGLPCSFKRP